MSYLPQTKYGDCCQCSARNTNVVKVKKDLFCIQCHQSNKTKVQIQKANNRQKVRSLITYQREEGVLDSIQELILDLDRVTSRMVRLAAMDKDGKVKCFTCSSRKVFKNMQCGHFIPRANLVFRFDWTYNLRPQCSNCNITLRGNLARFAENLERERNGIVECMQEEARKVYSPSRDELKQMLFDYQQRLNILEKKLTFTT